MPNSNSPFRPIRQLRGVPNVVVEGGMFLYYAEGKTDERLVLGERVGKYVAPDLIVVLDHDLGAGARTRCGRRASRRTSRWR